MTALAFFPDDKVLVSGSKDRTLRVWDIRSAKELLVYRDHRAALTAVACSPDGKTVASGDAVNAVHLWDRSTGALRHRLVLNPTPPADEDRTGITSLVFSSDGKTLFVGSRTLRFTDFIPDVWGLTVSVDAATGIIVREVRESGRGPDAITADGRMVACSSLTWSPTTKYESKLLLRKFDSEKVGGRVAEGMDLAFGRMAFSSDGRTLAVHSAPRGLCARDRSDLRYCCLLWEVATGKVIVRLEGGATRMSFAPGGRLLAGANEGEHGVRLFSAVTGEIVGRLSGHTAAVTCCVFSPDGTRLATGNADGTILLWDATKFPTLALPEVSGLQPCDLDKLWSDLSSNAAAHHTIWKLTAIPARSLPLLRECLKPVPRASAASVDGLIKDLDCKAFRKREQAAAALGKLGEQAIPALRRLLRGKPTLELRRRAERLLDPLEGPLSPEQLRSVRAVTVLERIGTADARQTLQTLARGTPGVRLTEEARAALERLRRGRRETIRVPGQ